MFPKPIIELRCEDAMRILLIIMLIASIVIPFMALGYADGKEQAEVLKTNRVYISKAVFDDFVKNNP